MLVTNHVLSGAFVGRAASGPVSAFVAGVASHFALDAVPHWGDGRPIREVMHIAVPDGLLGLTAMAGVTAATEPSARLRVLAGMAGAAFPDLDKPADRFLGFSPFPRRWDAFHQAVQHESAGRMPQEVLVGLAQVALLAALARRRPSGQGLPGRTSPVS
ncbi:hypothetical protein G7072_04920 [Nocardioides sp. HDW12B]|uniref:hypothetical protein n=1 Tax=Nocardioides sp. HDW12B TaxID=2714939 RepID=UPI00140CF512|nr:hypothetical protein [Nocardioides sp. HDW12B]QIK65768.1 hypothetical protein G7072_04920 [Nocardioides sp. HDW12B]